MRRVICIISSALLAWLLSAPVAKAQISYLDCLEWHPGEVRIVADSASGLRNVELDMVIRWKDSPYVSPQHTVCIVPVLKADSVGEFSFTPVFMDGRIRSKVLRRSEALNPRLSSRPDSAVVVAVGRKAPRTMLYSAAIPYSPAMLDGSLVLYETVHGCAECLEGTDSLVLADVLPRYVPHWDPGFMQSPDGDDKSRKRSYRADLTFRVNLSRVEPGFGNNASVLEGIAESVRTALNDTLYTVRAVRFMGWASPEGPERFNTSLASARAYSLADYVRKAMDDAAVPDSLFIVEGGAEDWDGFFEAVSEHGAIAGNETIARVREALTASNRDSCERVLRSDRRLYSVLRTDILPSLRRTGYVIEYDIRDFTPEEAEQLWQEHPEWLSINEMNSVAGLYGEDDPRCVQVLLAAARTYPLDVAAVHNAAMALHRAGMTAEALSLLSGRSEPGLLNTLGLVLCEEELYDQALTAFRTAADAGSQDASHNLEELEKVMEQL